MSYDSWKTNYDGWLESQEVRSRCECCHRLRYGCVDRWFRGENWHICQSCNEHDDPRDAYVDPDNARDSRIDR